MKKVIYSALVVTFFLSLFNWYEEGHAQGAFFSTVGSVFGGFIATYIYIQVERKGRLNCIPFAISALISVFFALFAYTVYAFNGRSDSLESAGHMHIFMFPVFHTLVSLVFVFLALVVSLVLRVWAQFITKQSA